MASMTTVVSFFSTFGDTLKLTLPLHTVQRPKTLTQTRKVPVSGNKLASGNCEFNYAADDSAGDALPERIKLTANYAVPIYRASDTELNLAITAFRDFVASDEFDIMVKSQKHVPEALWT